MKFDIKDFNYLGIILALTVALLCLNESNKHKSIWCNDFFNEFKQGL
tara:strand:+ start:693 stop:833 length:141 start_codon:yes stop_codon:yes gene_type:complete